MLATWAAWGDCTERQVDHLRCSFGGEECLLVLLSLFGLLSFLPFLGLLLRLLSLLGDRLLRFSFLESLGVLLRSRCLSLSLWSLLRERDLAMVSLPLQGAGASTPQQQAEVERREVRWQLTFQRSNSSGCSLDYMIPATT